MKRVVAGLAAGAVWLVAAMPALAQQPPEKSVDGLTDEQTDELYCVYDTLSFFGDSAAMTTAYMGGDPDSADYADEVLASLDEATGDCSEGYEWEQSREDTASMIGLYGVMGDEIETRLAAAGLTEANIATVYDVIDAMSDDDIGAFLDGVTAAKDAGVMQRLKAGLEAKGIKGDGVMHDAFYLAEAYVVVSVLTREWLTTMPKS
ncbi:MAG TPA: hypothetical protein PLN33_13920 [Hyphomonadaceae bacterium]|nr:hypothetical protein [Hyphomonadaceae bacterium]HPN04626.1 hypothetical protein [Hyphomonadaceae bacterium]